MYAKFRRFCFKFIILKILKIFRNSLRFLVHFFPNWSISDSEPTNLTALEKRDIFDGSIFGVR